MAKRMIETNLTEEDVKIEGSLRPQVLDDYIGQSKVKETLKIYIEAARQRGLAQARRAVKQHMIQGVTPLSGRFDIDF